jgi:electron transfer flavoprotein alpha subunit
MRDDDVELLARAQAVVGVGAGVAPTDYAHLDQLRGILGAEMAATRKVTDKGYIPRARQLGITGRAISPRLYFAIGLSGKFNHMVGVRAAQTVVEINNDENALVFGQCDIGIVGEWHEAVDALVAALTEAGYAPA